MKMSREEFTKSVIRAAKLVHRGQFIESIKSIRVDTGCGLSEAYHAALIVRANIHRILKKGKP